MKTDNYTKDTQQTFVRRLTKGTKRHTYKRTHKQTYCGHKQREKNIKNEGPYVLLLLK